MAPGFLGWCWSRVRSQAKSTLPTSCTVRLAQQTIGYWIGKDFAGRNATPIAVALAIDHLFEQLGLHRVEIDIRPENAPSLRVVEKLGLRKEGLKERYIHIDGAWRDHLVFAITKEEVQGSMLGRLSNTLEQ
jgi:[ribosomal protein S5]-alanine N-acetyltransferase